MHVAYLVVIALSLQLIWSVVMWSSQPASHTVISDYHTESRSSAIERRKLSAKEHEFSNLLVVFVIAGGEKAQYVYFERYWRQMARVMSYFGVHVYLLKQDEHQVEDVVMVGNHTLFFKGKPSLTPGILQMTLGAIEYVMDKKLPGNDAKFMLRTNLSSFYCMKELLKWLWKFKDEKMFYAGPLYFVMHDDFTQGNQKLVWVGYEQELVDRSFEFASGSGFVVSRDLMLMLPGMRNPKYPSNNPPKDERFRHSLMEAPDDVALGYYIRTRRSDGVWIPVIRKDFVRVTTLRFYRGVFQLETLNLTSFSEEKFHYRVKYGAEDNNAAEQQFQDVAVFSSLFSVGYLEGSCIPGQLPDEQDLVLLDQAAEAQRQEEKRWKNRCTNVKRDAAVAAENGCAREFVKYVSSDLENVWLEHIDLWEKKACRVFTEDADHREMVERMLNFTTANLKYPSLSVPDDMRGSVFSKFVWKLKCADTPVIIQEEYIEPLAGILRDPRGVCPGWPERSIQSKDFILLSKPWKRQLPIHIFDFANRPSRKWFLEKYENLGFRFENYLAFERIDGTPASVAEEIPKDLLPVYRNFDVSISADPDNTRFAWRFVENEVSKRTKKINDHVAVLLDIDQPVEEFLLVQHLLKSKDLHAVVDEFFFEHHVDMPEMRRFWKNRINGTLSLSYRTFLALRQAGIRAHSWP